MTDFSKDPGYRSLQLRFQTEQRQKEQAQRNKDERYEKRFKRLVEAMRSGDSDLFAATVADEISKLEDK